MRQEISLESASINTRSLPKRVELQTGTPLGLRDGGAQTWEDANLPPASLLMPTICVCNSSPAGQEPPQARTQVNKHPERAI